jgi:meiosis protein SPO22/ZIP4
MPPPSSKLTVAGFAHSLLAKLSSAQIDASLIAEIEHQTRTAAHVTQRQQVKRLFGKELSTTARNLWNTCVRLPPPRTDESSVETLRLRTRQFAFTLMHLAKWPGPVASGTSFDDIVLLLTMLFKICRLCLKADGTDAAVDAITKAAHCVALLPDLKARLSPEQLEECRGLEVQNLCLRTALAWREGRLEVAEAMYAKTEPLREGLDSEAAERLAEVLYEIGRGLAEKAQYGPATTWLRRMLDVLSKQDVEMMSREALNLKDAAYQTLVTALLETGVEDDLVTAAGMVQQMAEEMGEKPVVLAMRLEIFDKASDEQFDGKIYADAILCVNRLLPSTDTNAGLVHQHIVSLHQRNPVIGCKTMDQWLFKQAQAGRMEGLEAGIRERINMATVQKGVTQTIFDLIKVLDGLLELGTPPIDGAIAFNAQAVRFPRL